MVSSGQDSASSLLAFLRVAFLRGRLGFSSLAAGSSSRLAAAFLRAAFLRGRLGFSSAAGSSEEASSSAASDDSSEPSERRPPPRRRYASRGGRRSVCAWAAAASPGGYGLDARVECRVDERIARIPIRPIVDPSAGSPYFDPGLAR